MIRSLKPFLLLSIFICYSCTTSKSVIQPVQPRLEIIKPEPPDTVFSGLENFLQNHIHLVKDKRVGLVTNPSGIDRNFKSITDLLFQHQQINLTTLFGVEHGIRGDASAGQKIKDFKDPITSLPVYSLYGNTKKPTVEMLDSIDVIIFDIQDVGIRSYTYISSMGMIIEAATENNVEVIILDRPNPLGGNAIEGNTLKKKYQSHVGYFKIPYRHGMTMGEIAHMYNQEDSIGCKLKVIPVLNWKRQMFWNETGLPWIPTSPHVPHWETTLFMPITGIIGELQIVNIGVGYTAPFEFIAAPWINAQALADSLNSLNLDGLYFRPTHFKPYYSTFKGEICHGVQIHITDKTSFKPFLAGLHILKILIDLYPEQDLVSNPGRLESFNVVLGSSKIYDDLISGKSVEQMEAEWQIELDEFLKIREKYLMY